MKHRTLKAFTKAVNALARADAEAMNADGGYASMFKAVHHDFPEAMMEHYFNEGYEPREVIERVQQEAEIEAAWEARVS